MSDVDLGKLRVPFPPEHVGKLPRVICTKCSRGNGTCEDHPKKVNCQECGSWISPRHIHLDYVGHADVTIRLLEVDPEWTWEPKATDPDPDALKAALASGDAEIVRMVITNAPPKFETDRNDNPVGLWIKLTVGGVTRLGYGSCPGGQNDAEKVLIGDALRNAALRFGVAVDLWAKGDRADPSSENATASGGQAARRRPQDRPAGNARQPQPSRPAPQLAPEDPWSVRIEAVTSLEDADLVNTDLKQMHAAGEIGDEHARQVKGALDARAAEIRSRRQQPARNGQQAEGPEGEAEWVREFTGRLGAAREDREFLGMRTELAKAVSSGKIAPATGNDLITELNERKAKAAEAVPS